MSSKNQWVAGTQIEWSPFTSCCNEEMEMNQERKDQKNQGNQGGQQGGGKGSPDRQQEQDDRRGGGQQGGGGMNPGQRGGGQGGQKDQDNSATASAPTKTANRLPTFDLTAPLPFGGGVSAAQRRFSPWAARKTKRLGLIGSKTHSRSTGRTRRGTNGCGTA